MNPYTPQANQNNLYAYNQNFMANLPPELINSFNQQNNAGNGNGNTNSPQQQQQPQMFDQQAIPNMFAKRQVYSNNPMFNMVAASSMENSPAISMATLQSPQRLQSPMMTPQQQLLQLQQQQQFRSPQPQPQPQQPQQQQQWQKQQQQQQQQLAFQRMDEQQKRQFLMLQQQQMRKAQQMQQQQLQQQQLQQQQQQLQQQQLQQQQQQQQQQQHQQQQHPHQQQQILFSAANTMDPSNAADALSDIKKTGFSVNETELNTKRVEVILAMNKELIRLFIENKNAGGNLDADITAYQAKLQSNLTFLATMADISMVKPGEDIKIPPPPDLTPLPPAKSDIEKKIHELLNNAISLFESYPTSNYPVEAQQNQHKRSESSTQQSSPNLQQIKQPQQQQQQQQQLLQQQQAAAAAVMRQQQQQQQQFNMNRMGGMNGHMVSTPPTTAIGPNMTLNPNMGRNNMMMDPQAILRQAQQAQNLMQQQQMIANMGLNISSPPNNVNISNGFSPIQQSMDSPSMTSIPLQQPQQMAPTDLLAANGMINPSSILINPNNNLMLGGNNMYVGENGEDFSDVMMMMQRLQQ